jgi:DNA-binding HxlR family transcriptional regulator/putative sterol carrier protein
MDEQAPARGGRSYNQYCAVARGLDIIGERWTLLMIRDLLAGPKRYTDLLDNLPGIGTNLLAARLRDLEAQGIVRRMVLPPPAGSTVYELTELGEALEPVIMALGRWGARLLGTPRDTDSFPIDAFIVAMRASFRPEEAAGLKETYELRVGGRAFEFRLDGGRLTTTQGSARNPDAVLTMNVMILYALVKQGLPAKEAVATGQVTVEGDPIALERFVRIFRLGQREDDAQKATARKSPARRSA